MEMLLNVLAVVLVARSSSVHCTGVEAGGGISNQHHQQDDAGNYHFGYQVQDPTSHQFRRESGDAYGRVVGSYGLSEADGRHRIVDYVADEYGFRAKVRTNEPGTGSENSAAVQVSQPGHPPGPPRIPHPVAPVPPPSGQTRVPLAQPPIKSPVPYSASPYSYPYYYSPVSPPDPNSLFSPPGKVYAPYIGHPGTYAKIVDSQKYAQSPAVPVSAGSGQRYAPPLPEAGSPATPARLDLPGEATDHRLGLVGSKLPANYRVVPIPNGIRAVPVDSLATSDLGGGVYSPYQSAVEGRYSRPAYFGTGPGHSDSHPAKAYYAYPPTDYRLSGSGKSQTLNRVSQIVDH